MYCVQLARRTAGRARGTRPLWSWPVPSVSTPTRRLNSEPATVRIYYSSTLCAVAVSAQNSLRRSTLSHCSQ